MYYPYMRQYTEQQQRIMTVTGNGSVSVKPNVITIQMEIVTENQDLKAVQAENAMITNRVIESLLSLGIAKENIQTSGYNIYPNYDYIDGKEVFRGYRVTNTLTVKLNKIDQAGVIIDTAVQNGVNQISNIQFSVDNKQEYYQEALRIALGDASEKAKVIAGTMKLNLDPYPIKITEQELNEIPVAYKTFAAADGNPTTPIEPGQIIIEATVRAQFQYFN